MMEIMCLEDYNVLPPSARVEFCKSYCSGDFIYQEKLLWYVSLMFIWNDLNNKYLNFFTA